MEYREISPAVQLEVLIQELEDLETNHLLATARGEAGIADLYSRRHESVLAAVEAHTEPPEEPEEEPEPEPEGEEEAPEPEPEGPTEA